MRCRGPEYIEISFYLFILIPNQDGCDMRCRGPGYIEISLSENVSPSAPHVAADLTHTDHTSQAGDQSEAGILVT